jgi:TP901 family phage tail tape measure protein
VAISTRDVLVVVRARDVASRIIRDIGTSFGHVEGEARKAAQRIQGIGGALTAVGVGMAAAGVAGAGALGVSARAAAEYRNQAALALTQTYELGASLDDLREIGLRVARDVPQPLDQMQSALYDIFSTVEVGLPAAEHMLNQFSRAAVAGQTDIQTAGRLTMAMMNAFRVPVSEVSNLMDMQFQLVARGTGTYKDFAESIGNVIPPAAAANQTIDTMLGSVGFLTRQGLSASRAATSVGRAIEQAFSTDAVANLEEIGVEVQNAEGEFRQLNDIIHELVTSRGWGNLTGREFRTAFEDVFGRGQIQARRFFDLAFQNIDSLNWMIGTLGDEAEGAMGAAFDTMADQAVASWQRIMNALQELRIVIGEDVLPVIMPVLEWVVLLIRAFTDLDPELRQAAVRFFLFASIALGVSGVLTALVGLFLLLAGTLMYMGLSFTGAVGTIIAFQVAIVGITSLGIWLIRNWEQVSAFFNDFWPNLIEMASTAWQAIERAIIEPTVSIVNNVTEALNQLQRNFATIMTNILRGAQTVGMMIYEALRNLSPFTRHSPSLIDEIREGDHEILNKYANLDKIIPAIDKAIAAVGRFQDAAGGLRADVEAQEQAELRQYLSVVGTDLVQAYNAATGAIEELRQKAEAIGVVYKQEMVVLVQLAGEVEKASKAFEEQEAILEGLQKVVKAFETELRGEQATLRGLQGDLRRAEQAYKNARKPIADVEDEIAALETVLSRQERTMQRARRSLDQARDGYNRAKRAVEDIESAVSDAERQMNDFANAALKGSRAYSDALFGLDQQAAGVRKTMLKWEGMGAPPETLDYFQYQLDEINRAAEGIRLDEQLELDPLRRSLQQAADASKELTFEEAMAGIQAAKAEIESLTAELPAAIQEMLNQEVALAAAEENYKQYEDAVNSTREAIEGLQAQVDEFDEGLDHHLETIRNLKDAISDQQFVVDELRDSMADAQDAVDNQRDAYDEAAERLREANEAYREQEQVLSDLETAYDRIQARIRDWGSTIDEVVSMARGRYEELQRAAEEAARAASAKKGGAGKAGGAGGADVGALDWLKDLEDAQASMADFEMDDFTEDMLDIDTSGLDDMKDALEGVISTLERFQGWFKWIGGIAAAFAGWKIITGIIGGVSAAFAFLRGLNIITWIQLMAGAAGQWLMKWGLIRGAVAAVGVVLGSTVGIIITAVLAIGAIFVWLWNNVEGFREFWIGVWEAVSTAVSNAWAWITETVSTAWAWLMEIFIGIQTWIMENLLPMWQSLSDAVSTAWTTIMETISMVWNEFILPIFTAIQTFITETLIPVFTALWEGVQTVWTGIMDVITFAWEIISGIWNAIYAVITGFLIPVFRFLFEVVQGVWNLIGIAITAAWFGVIKPIWNALIDFVKNVLQVAWQTMRDVFTSVWRGISEVARTVWETAIKPIWNAIKTFIQTVLLPVWGNLKTTFKSVWDSIVEAARWAWDTVIKPIWNAIKTFINDVLLPTWRTMRNVWSDVWNTISSKISTIWDGIKSTIRSSVNSILGFVERMVNGIIDGLNRAGDALNQLPGFNISRISRISLPRIARGGDITSGGWAHVGERGPEDVFLPAGARVFPQGAFDGNGTKKVEVNINEGAFQFNGPIDSATLPDVQRMLNDFRDELAMELRKQ